MGDVLAITNKLGWGLVDTESGEYSPCDPGKSNVSRPKDFFGITWDDNYLYTLGREADHIKQFDGNLKYLGNLDLPVHLKDGHQILWIEKYEEFVLTDAQKERIVIFKPGTLKAHTFPITCSGVDESHVNSLYFEEDTNRLFTICHNKGKSCIKIFNYPDLSEPIEEKWIGVKAHNIWFEENVLTICSSGRKQIVDEKGNVRYQCKGFVRGAAVTEDRIYAGQSGWRKNTGKYKFHGIGKRRSASISVLDRDYNQIGEIFLPPRIKEIFDIRILNRFDYSHNKKGFWQECDLD